MPGTPPTRGDVRDCELADDDGPMSEMTTRPQPDGTTANRSVRMASKPDIAANVSVTDIINPGAPLSISPKLCNFSGVELMQMPPPR